MNQTSHTPEFAARIGDQLLAEGRLTPEQLQAILALQQSEDLRFGDAAIRLGYLTPEELQRILSAQFGYTTSLASTSDSWTTPLAIAHAPFSQEAEAIRQIRVNLASFQEHSAHLTFAVVSPAAKEGKSYLAASLAIAFAQAGQTTLLINADLRPSGQPELLSPPRHHTPHGLSTVLAGRSHEIPLRAISGYPHLQVLDAGPTPPNPLELLADPALRRLLDELRQHFQVIVLDTPAALGSSDATVIARQARSAVMVGRRDLSRLNQLQSVQEELGSHGVTLLGTVYNTAPLSQTTPDWMQRWGLRWRERRAGARPPQVKT